MIDNYDIEEFEDIMDKIADLADRAYHIVKQSNDKNLADVAKAYWYGNLKSAINDEQFIVSKYNTMQYALERLKFEEDCNGDPETDKEDLGPSNDDD